MWMRADGENVPYARSRKAIERARRRHGADITLITIHNAPHSFLVEDAQGAVHYTNHCWPEMAQWLHARGVTKRAFRNCGWSGKP